MKANELRIGNYVQRIGYPLKVTGIKGGDVWVDGNAVELEYYVYDGINPIPITEEWLVKFGFEVYDVMGDNIFLAFRQIEPFNFNFMLCGVVLKVSFYRLDWEKSFECKYVHQLQNLYFALTGEELQIK